MLGTLVPPLALASYTCYKYFCSFTLIACLIYIYIYAQRTMASKPQYGLRSNHLEHLSLAPVAPVRPSPPVKGRRVPLQVSSQEPFVIPSLRSLPGYSDLRPQGLSPSDRRSSPNETPSRPEARCVMTETVHVSSFATSLHPPYLPIQMVAMQLSESCEIDCYRRNIR